MKSAKNTFIAVACLAAIAVSGRRVYVATQSEATEPETAFRFPKPAAEGFTPMQVVPPFPAITNAPMIQASQVARQVTDDELVLGVVIEGEARAYPINMLTGPAREIINDSIGGLRFAATW